MSEEADKPPPPSMAGFPHYEQALRALRYVTGSKRTICEVHRMLYDEIEKVADPEAKARMAALVEEAFLLGKKMDAKLRQYKGKHPESWYEAIKPDMVVARRELRAARPGAPGTPSGKTPHDD